MANEAIIRLKTRPYIEPTRGCHVDRFEAHLDGELICVSRQPRLDSARVLLKRGYPAGMLLTTRAHNRNYDSFVPRPIGELAEETMVEGSRDGLRRRKWEPFEKVDSAQPVEARTRKSGLRGVQVPGVDEGAVAPDRVTSGSAAA